MTKKISKKKFETTFPAFVTKGKIVRNKLPFLILWEMDNWENRRGKKVDFNGMQVFEKIAGMPLELGEDKNSPLGKLQVKAYVKKFNKTFNKLVELGAIVPAPENDFVAIDKKCFRLSAMARATIQYSEIK